MVAEADLTKAENEILARHNVTEFGRHPTTGLLMAKIVCPRCWGTGTFSHCSQWGSRCFDCDVASGGKQIGYVWQGASRVAKRLRRGELAAAKAAKRSAAEADRRRELDGRIDITIGELIATVEPCKAKHAESKKHIGTVGHKWEGVVRHVATIQLPDTGYGAKSLVKMDHEGSELAWFTGSPIRFEKDEVVRIRCTIKDHGTYRGLRQTAVIRVSVVE